VVQVEHEQANEGWGPSVYTARVTGDQEPGGVLHIRSVLTRRIRDGEYPAGAKLPTETELAEEFGCRPGTAARALRLLRWDGLAKRVLRKGYFSSGPGDRPS
jgi:DNA-binding GntR family transcriptional regulator